MASYFSWPGGTSGAGQLQSSGMLTKEQLLQLFRDFASVLALPGEPGDFGLFFAHEGCQCWLHFCEIRCLFVNGL